MCLFPLSASPQLEGGRPLLDPEGSLKLPCGKCFECISKRSLEWATRARHEISEHIENCFLTLTYSPENLNSHFIVKSDFQKFMKKLRKTVGKKLTYMVSYEYGSEFFRPHMHALIFGYNPKNQSFLKKTSSGYPLFTSPVIEKLWDKGFHSIAEANEKTAYYIASYALSGKSRILIHPDTGEECQISDTMDVSKRPAIGLSYLKKNMEQLVDSKIPLPRYYQKKLEQLNPDLFQEYQDNANLCIANRSSEELYAKFIIQDQKISVHDSEYRIDYRDDRQKEFFERRLKQDRNNYVAKTKGLL